MTVLKRGELERALERPDPSIRLWLFAGPEESASHEAASRALKKLSDADDPMAITHIAASDLSGNPGLMADEAATVSMFGGTRAIRVDGAGEAVVPAVELLLSAPAAGNPVVMTSGDLKKTSGLRKLAEASPLVRIHLSYPLEGRDAQRFLADRAAALGMRLEPGVGERLIAGAGNDTGVLLAELQKYALYLDARPDGAPKQLGVEDLAVLAADSADEDMFALVAALTAGNVQRAERQLRLLAGSSAIPALRAMARRLLQLAEARTRMDEGMSADAAIAALRPPVFWKEKDALAAALPLWSMRRIRQAMAAMLAGEQAIKTPASPGDTAGWHALQALLPRPR